jgi:hypothetical protein
MAVSLLISAKANAQSLRLKTSAIGIRGSMVMGNSGHMSFHVSEKNGENRVSTGNMGGSFFLMSRVSDQFLLEFSIGAYARVFHDSYYHWDKESHVYSTAPLLMGLNFELLPVTVQVNIRPYVSFGPAAYLLSNVQVIENDDEKEASIDSIIRAGFFAGGGFNFFVTEKFGVNFDLKYHFVDFNPALDRSGAEMSLGLVFTWGELAQKTYSVPLPLNVRNSL